MPVAQPARFHADPGQRRRSVGRAVAAVVGLLVMLLSLSAADAAGAPPISAADALQLTAAAGMSVQNGRVLNPCGHPTSPQIRFGDFNGDGVQEAITLDHDPACYGPDPGYQTKILMRDRSGQWHVVATAPGMFLPLPTRSHGWQDFSLMAPGCQPVWRFDGRSYQTSGPCAVNGAPPVAAAPAPPPRAASRDAAPAPAPASGSARVSATDHEAIFRAADVQRKNGKWSGCADAPDDGSDNSATIESVSDVNGDGRPDAVVVLNGMYCYGNTGQAFVLVSQKPDGRWVRMASQTGILTFLPTKGRDGWPDIEVGGPGFCFPVLRWNGSIYMENRWENEGKPCRR